MENKTHHILVRGVNWIGDAVMTIPAMRALRCLFPESRITLLIQKPIDRLFASFSAVDHVIGFSIRKGFPGLLDRLSIIRELRKEHYDLCLILPNSFDSALLTFLSGIPERVGFQRDGRGFLLSRGVPPPEAKTSGHQAGDYLSLASALGPVQDSLELHLEVEESAKIWAGEQVASLQREVRGPLIGVSPGATYGPAKRWFPDRFADLATRLCVEKQAGIVIVGGPKETELCSLVAARIQGKVMDLSGKTDLQQLAAVLSLCDLMVTNDSGPMHVGSAVNVPVVAIFGSTEPGATSPLGRHLIVTKECECSPCLDRSCRREDILCMRQIQVEDVFDAVERTLGERGET
jgi:heptosyltransferase-2